MINTGRASDETGDNRPLQHNHRFSHYANIHDSIPRHFLNDNSAKEMPEQKEDPAQMV